MLSVTPDAPGRIILLNGVSSSGKSSIARELVTLLDEVYFVMAVDAFHAMRAPRDYAPEEFEAVMRRTRAGFHGAVAAMAEAGNNVVVDHVLSEQWRLDDCLARFEGVDVFFVGVRCDLAELERRERQRGDRPAGLAAGQSEQVHAHGDYDLDCDTTSATAHECAVQVNEFLAGPSSGRAFDRLRARGR